MKSWRLSIDLHLIIAISSYNRLFRKFCDVWNWNNLHILTRYASFDDLLNWYEQRARTIEEKSALPPVYVDFLRIAINKGFKVKIIA